MVILQIFLRGLWSSKPHWSTNYTVARVGTSVVSQSTREIISPRYEEITRNPAWLKTCSIERPWSVEPSFMQLYHDEDAPEAFLKTDCWHNWHGGLGKTFHGSAWQELHKWFDGSNMDERYDNIDGHAKEYCKETGMRLCLGTIKHTTFGGNDQWPEGSWSKFHDTTVMTPASDKSMYFKRWYDTSAINYKRTGPILNPGAIKH
jgi:hypothetical protein